MSAMLQLRPSAITVSPMLTRTAGMINDASVISRAPELSKPLETLIGHAAVV